jgi:hypothetical protein
MNPNLTTDKGADKLFMIMNDELVAMSEQEILDVFEELQLSSEEDRRGRSFEEYDPSEEARIHIEVLAHTGAPVAEPKLWNA